jgi:nicotinamide phosphoribosyltransferase
MNNLNPILNTDSYKLSHFLQFPPGTTAISAHIETRGQSEVPDVVFFGLQMFLKAYLARAVTATDIDEAAEIVEAHGLPFDREGWDHILAEHGGHLPVRIEALAEGSVVRRGVPVLQLTSTDPKVPWTVSHLETALTRAIWYPSTIASQARGIREQLKPLIVQTCDEPEKVLPSRLHDFGARGMASLEQAGIGSAAHLLFFDRTDTIAGVLNARAYYGAEMAGHSYPASEHATMAAWGQAREEEAYAHMIDTFSATGPYAVVSDSFDLNYAISEIWGKALHDKVMQPQGRLIIRPDRGDPIDTPIQAISQLAYAFGTHQNAKGYKVLNGNVHVIQSGGILPEDMLMVLRRLEATGFSAENISFGIGAGLLHDVGRGNYGFTMRTNARLDTDGKWHDIQLRPGHIHETPHKTGRQAVAPAENGELQAVRIEELGSLKNSLVPVWENGELLKDWSFEDIRKRATA